VASQPPSAWHNVTRRALLSLCAWVQFRGECASGRGVDRSAWTVIGSATGVVDAAAAVVFGLVPLLAARRRAAHPGTALADAGTATYGARPLICPAGTVRKARQFWPPT
jgi:hypothetical protein